MNKTKPSAGSETAQSNINILISTLRLLDCDKLHDWLHISASVLASRDAGPNQRRRIDNAEWIFYQLFNIWDSAVTLDKLRPFFPPFEPIQSLNLRAALFRWLNQLKMDGVLGKDVMLRKTMFDDCKGDKFIELMAVLSVVVLRKQLSTRQDGKGSVARELSAATMTEHSDHVPLIMAQKFGLANSLAQRSTLRKRYGDFGEALDMKDKEVERRFAKIVETQDFLDQNIAPEATVARITKQFEDHWQADRHYVRAVTQGDETTTNDAFLDQPFHEIWSDVSSGTYAPDFSLSRNGVLEDLEGRVAVQATRLHEWKRYRAELQQKNRSPPKIDSPVRKPDILSPKDRASEKALVFSPRKSPRKSELPTRSPLNSTPIKSSPSFVYRKDSPLSVPRSPESPLTDMNNFLKRRQSHVKPVTIGTPDTDHNDSGFSEISDHDLTTRFDVSVNQPAKTEDKEALPKLTSERPASKGIDAQGFVIPQKKSFPDANASQESGSVRDPNTLAMKDEAYHANAILAATFNAAPTPSKPPLTLEERTRQSMAHVSPISRLTTATQPSLPRQDHTSTAHATDSPHLAPLPRLNLADRTRQSISLATLSKPKPQPRKSLNNANRRDSRVFPVNQFETPGRGGRRESGFDERAGYDSVFKSRPKVGMSPRGGTPVREVDEEGEGGVDLLVGMESPLGRMGVV